MSGSVHTIVALGLVALVPIAPVGMRVYATVQSEDRGKARATAERVLASAPPPAGATRDGTSAYEVRAWEGRASCR